MSSRHWKRLQKEKADDFEKDSSESEEEVQQRGNLFAFLPEDEQVSSETVSESESSNNEYAVVNARKRPNRAEKNKNQSSFDWDEELDNKGDLEPLIRNTVKWSTIDLDGLEESKEIRERTGSVNGQLKRPAGKIIAPRKNWPKMPAAALGFTVQKVTGHEYRVVASEEYIEKFYSLQVIISSADVAALTMFNKDFPEVVEGYLLLSDIVRQHSVADAAALTEVALYFLEKSFPIGLHYSECIFKYDEYPDSRSIHLALFRHIQFLIRRASWTTALECAKILYNIDKKDPLLAILFIDYIYLQTKNVGCHDELYAELGNDCRYPFLKYSNAILHNCFDALNTLEAFDVLHKREFKENYTHSVFKLYFSRTSSYWKSVKLPELELVSNDCRSMSTDKSLSVYRHGLLSDQQNIHLAYPSSSTLSLDPFPPTSDGMEYSRLKNPNSNSLINLLVAHF